MWLRVVALSVVLVALVGRGEAHGFGRFRGGWWRAWRCTEAASREQCRHLEQPAGFLPPEVPAPRYACDGATFRGRCKQLCEEHDDCGLQPYDVCQDVWLNGTLGGFCDHRWRIPCQADDECAMGFGFRRWRGGIPEGFQTFCDPQDNLCDYRWVCETDADCNVTRNFNSFSCGFSALRSSEYICVERRCLRVVGEPERDVDVDQGGSLPNPGLPFPQPGVNPNQGNGFNPNNPGGNPGNDNNNNNNNPGDPGVQFIP